MYACIICDIIDILSGGGEHAAVADGGGAQDEEGAVACQFLNWFIEWMQKWMSYHLPQKLFIL